MEYTTLTPADQAAIHADVTAQQDPTPPTPDYAILRPAWEADHYAHSLLLAVAQASGDEEAVKVHSEAMKTIEDAIDAIPTTSTTTG